VSTTEGMICIGCHAVDQEGFIRPGESDIGLCIDRYGRFCKWVKLDPPVCSCCAERFITMWLDGSPLPDRKLLQ
jgi:hypothetical protein